MPPKSPYKFKAIGRRKEAVARVYLKEGKGEFEINGRTLENFFCREKYRAEVLKPFKVVKSEGKFFTHITVAGGGTTGQAEAIRLGIARALCQVNVNNRMPLKREDLLERDARAVERKKYGQAGARRRFQYSKR